MPHCAHMTPPHPEHWTAMRLDMMLKGIIKSQETVTEKYEMAPVPPLKMIVYLMQVWTEGDTDKELDENIRPLKNILTAVT